MRRFVSQMYEKLANYDIILFYFHNLIFIKYAILQGTTAHNRLIVTSYCFHLPNIRFVYGSDLIQTLTGDL